jgi:hypothetical protein
MTKLTRKEKHAIRKFNQGCHDLVMCTVYFEDRTYLTRQFDLKTGKKTIEIEGNTYNLPTFPCRTRGFWPFKPRNLMAYILPDKHYAVDWMEGNPEPISIVSAHSTASKTNILPSTFSSMVRENMNMQMLASLRKKANFSMDSKKLILILVLVGVAAFIVLKFGGLI